MSERFDKNTALIFTNEHTLEIIRKLEVRGDMQISDCIDLLIPKPQTKSKL